MLTGENGILNRANDAKEQTKVAEAEEKSKINNYEEIIDEYTNPERKAMKIVVNSGTDKKIVLPIEINSEDDYVIDWGDGTTSERGDGARTHIYSEANKDYIVTISGTLKQISSYASETTKSQIKQILQWGETGLTSISLSGCSNLIEIASPTSESFVNITSFGNSFEYTGITSIPENLFANCTNVTSFYETFANTEITSIPENLFVNCSKATDFYKTFAYCANLTNAIPLWEQEYYKEKNSNVSETTAGVACYAGCTTLLNTDIYIPDYWKNDDPE